MRHYRFKTIKTSTNKGKFSSIMIKGCKKLGLNWKPLCEHPHYCRDDTASIYIGQDYDIAAPNIRNGVDNNNFLQNFWKLSLYFS